MEEYDIFSLDNKNSLSRRRLHSEEPMNLKNHKELSIFQVPDVYSKETFFKTDDAKQEIRTRLSTLASTFEKENFSHNIFTAMYEGMLNAYQHAHEGDHRIPVHLSHNIRGKSLDVFIEDESGIFRPDFMEYVLRMRQGVEGTKDFYEFSGIPMNDVNLGSGTKQIFSYANNGVNYYKSPKSGLILHMGFKRKD